MVNVVEFAAVVIVGLCCCVVFWSWVVDFVDEAFDDLLPNSVISFWAVGAVVLSVDDWLIVVDCFRVVGCKCGNLVVAAEVVCLLVVGGSLVVGCVVSRSNVVVCCVVVSVVFVGCWVDLCVVGREVVCRDGALVLVCWLVVVGWKKVVVSCCGISGSLLSLSRLLTSSLVCWH